MFWPTHFNSGIFCCRHIQCPDQAGDQVLNPKRLNQRTAVARHQNQSGGHLDQPGQVHSEVVSFAIDHRASDDGVRQARFPDDTFRNSFRLHQSIGRCSIRAKMTEIKKPSDPRLPGKTRQPFQVVDFGFHQVGSHTSAFHPNEVIDHVHTPQRRTHTSFIIKRSQRDVHISLFRKGCLVNSWLQKHTVRFPKFGQVTDQIAAKKTSSTSH